MVYFPKGVATMMCAWCSQLHHTQYRMEPASPARLHSLRHLSHRCCYSLQNWLWWQLYHHQRNHNLLHTLLYNNRVILHCPRSTIFSFLSLPDYEHKSKKIISISQISKPNLYEMPFCMYQMTKRRRHKSKLQLAHNS